MINFCNIKLSLYDKTSTALLISTHMVFPNYVIKINAVLFLLLVLLGNQVFSFRLLGEESTSIWLTTERELNVSLDIKVGKIFFTSGKSNNLFLIKTGNKNLSNFLRYSIKNDIGYLNVNTNWKSSVKIFSDDNDEKNKYKSYEWHIELIDKIPISLDIELGVGEAIMDFSNLAIKNLRLSTGASSVSIIWKKQNKQIIENFNIEADLGKLDAVGLGYANFNNLKFKGGIGSYKLNFGGNFTQEADVDIEIGAGSLEIEIPENTGARIKYKKSLLSRININNDFKKEQDDIFYSLNYDIASRKVNIIIDSALGSIKVRRVQ